MQIVKCSSISLLCCLDKFWFKGQLFVYNSSSSCLESLSSSPYVKYPKIPTKISITNITQSTAKRFHKARSLVGSELSKNLSKIVTIIDASTIDPKAPKCLKNFLLLSEIRK